MTGDWGRVSRPDLTDLSNKVHSGGIDCRIGTKAQPTIVYMQQVPKTCIETAISHKTKFGSLVME